MVETTNVDLNDFLFKSAASNSAESCQERISNLSLSSDSSLPSSASMESQSFAPPTTTSTNTATIRIPELDGFIGNLRRAFESELDALGRERLNEFLKIDQEASVSIDFEDEVPDSNLSESFSVENLAELDAQEVAQTDELKRKAEESWISLREKYRQGQEARQSAQSLRLAQEGELQDEIRSAGGEFDLGLFERVVDRCGRGRNSQFGRERMARFWEVLDNRFAAAASTSSKASNDAKDDDLLALLKTL